MIIAAGRGKLRQISLQGHQGPLAHLYFHSHTLSLCYTRTDVRSHVHTRNSEGRWDVPNMRPVLTGLFLKSHYDHDILEQRGRRTKLPAPICPPVTFSLAYAGSL